MRYVYGFVRLVLACWLFLGGAVMALPPSASSLEREVRERERLLRAVPEGDREEWVRSRDGENRRNEATVRLVGVLMGGVGLAMVLSEAAYACGQWANRRG